MYMLFIYISGDFAKAIELAPGGVEGCSQTL
jgi:hypothetical protein